MLALGACTLSGCSFGGDEVAQRVQQPTLLSAAAVERQPAGSPGRAFLEWWRAMQFDDVRAGARHYAAASAVTREQLDRQLQLATGAFGARPRVVDVDEAGERATVLVLLETRARNPNGRVDVLRVPRSFELVREEGDWRLADNALSRACRARPGAPGRGAPGPAGRDAAVSGHVAVVLHEPQLGGATLSLLRALPLLERHGWTFSFWVPGRGPAEQELRRRGHEVAGAERRLRFSRASLRQPPGPARRLASVPGYLRSWRAWLRSQDPALIHANSILALPEVASRPRGGAPLVLHTHEVLPRGAKGAASAVLARRADVVVSVSGAAAKALRGFGIESTVVYGAVPDPGSVRAAGSGDGPLVVGTLGTVSRRKGSDLFVAAAIRIQEQRNGIEFRMAGAPVVGGERPWAEAVLAAAASNGIRHSPWVEPFAELPRWDVFVLPSRMDPCPLALLEAMAVGLPVVATSVGGIPEQLGTGSGLLVAPEDADGVADAVLRLAEAPELRARLGEAARERALTLFSLETQAAALDRVYRRALAGPGPGRPAPARRG